MKGKQCIDREEAYKPIYFYTIPRHSFFNGVCHNIRL